jgi:hypothetical protein
LSIQPRSRWTSIRSGMSAERVRSAGYFAI